MNQASNDDYSSLLDEYEDELDFNVEYVSPKKSTKKTTLGSASRDVGRGVSDIAFLPYNLASYGGSTLASLLGDQGKESTPAQDIEAQQMYQEDLSPIQQYYAMTSDEELVPRTPSAKNISEFREATAGESETTLGEILRRFTRSAPYAAGGPQAYGAAVGKELLGLTGSKGMERLGAPKWVQALTDIGLQLTPEIGARLIPGQITPKAKVHNLPRSGKISEAELVAEMRKAGAKEKDITTLLRSETKSGKTAQKLAEKGETGLVESIRKRTTENMFETLKGSKNFKKPLSPNQIDKLKPKMNRLLDKVSAAERPAMKEDVLLYLKNRASPDRGLDLYRNVDKNISDKSVSREFKNLIIDTVKDVDPQLGRTMAVNYDVASKYHKIIKNLSNQKQDRWKDVMSTLEKMGGGGTVLYGILNHDPSQIVRGAQIYAGGQAALMGLEKLGKYMLTSPRLYNLTSKLTSSVLQSNVPATFQLMHQIGKDLNSVEPGLGDQFFLSEKEIDEIMNDL